MATVNKGAVCSMLADSINSVTSSCDSEEFLITSVLEGVDRDKEFTVGSDADLPDLYTTGLPSGTLVFVERLNLHLVAVRNRWMTLDGREYRNDMATVGAWSWGCNQNGMLGDGTTVDKSSPVSVVGGFTDWCQVSAGSNHTAAVRQNGTIWAWGCNGIGRLGDGTAVDKSSPVSVVGGFTDWCRVGAGNTHTAAVRQNGTLWAWGSGGSGKLGDGTVATKSSPVSVLGGFTDWCRVSAGTFHTAAVRQNGTLWAWGSNANGRLGDGTAVNKSSPVSVIGGFTDWCQVSAGSAHTAAVRQNGTIWAWGCNNRGHLGDGTTVSKSSPVSVVGGFTDWCQVSAGCVHTAAVRQNGTLWAWGDNAQGILGDGTTVSKSSPVSVVGGFTDWCQVSAGNCHVSAIRQNGTLWAWGINSIGQLGDGTAVDKSSPVSVIGAFTDWCQVSAGYCGTAALRATK
jgi:alpha-tubulin suppressor-like RCC1 family protein